MLRGCNICECPSRLKLRLGFFDELEQLNQAWNETGIDYRLNWRGFLLGEHFVNFLRQLKPLLWRACENNLRDTGQVSNGSGCSSWSSANTFWSCDHVVTLQQVLLAFVLANRHSLAPSFFARNGFFHRTDASVGRHFFDLCWLCCKWFCFCQFYVVTGSVVLSIFY